jgi:predicted DNA-binding transcriptional regulator AlpA
VLEDASFRVDGSLMRMNARQSTTTPEAPGNGVTVVNGFGDKKAVAALAGLRSTRWVELEMAKGLPHLKLGARRVRFDLNEVREWLKTQYGQQHRGKAARV